MSGFISKWNLATASLSSSSGVLGMAGVVVLILSALLTAGYLLPIVTRGFFPGKGYVAGRGEVGARMTGPMLAFSTLSVFFGLFPGGLIDWINHLIARIF
jgi:multicomponent Na+:H+ antiporter subunit D